MLTDARCQAFQDNQAKLTKVYRHTAAFPRGNQVYQCNQGQERTVADDRCNRVSTVNQGHHIKDHKPMATFKQGSQEATVVSEKLECK
jgi:hypothetical protein